MKFSVLIPVYHKEKPEFFQEALSSIVNQTLKPSEIVIVKDGPLSHELENVISAYTENNPGLFKIVGFTENRGSGAARKLAVESSTYEIVTIMDSDDIAKPDRFETQIKFLQDNPEIDAVGSYVTEFEDNPQDIYAIRRVPLTHDDIVKYAKWRNPINQQTLMAKKNWILKAGNYSNNYKLMQDYHLWVKMMLAGAKFANIPECLVNMRAGKSMIKRRGMRVFYYELKFFAELYGLKFITFFELVRNLTCKFCLRIIPSRLRILGYNLFLRG